MEMTVEGIETAGEVLKGVEIGIGIHAEGKFECVCVHIYGLGWSPSKFEFSSLTFILFQKSV